MGWKSFTEEEILELKSNKYTHTVSASSISFTAEFKEKFWAMYKTGYKPKQILRQLGYDPDILGHNRIGGIRAHIREQALSPEGFHTGRRELIPKRPIEEYAEMPPSRAMIKIMNELAYLRQEVEFIKKLRKRRAGKGARSDYGKSGKHFSTYP